MTSANTSVTLQDVARLAGVSLATASRALNGSTRKVRPDIEAKVKAAAASLHYSPNAQAQAVARGRTNVLGLVVHDIADPYFASIAAGVTDGADRLGLLVTIAVTNRSGERELQHVAALRGQRASAIVLAGSRFSDDRLQASLLEEIRAFSAVGGRVVSISQALESTSAVIVDNEQGAHDLGRELVGRGYRRFAVLAGPTGLQTAEQRVSGFERGVLAGGHGAAISIVRHGDFSRDGGYDAARSLQKDLAGIDAVFAVNDVMAVGAMAALRDMGEPLPGRIGVAGFDDIENLRDVTPGLTTVRVPLRQIGDEAFKLAVSTDPEAQVRHVRGEVVIRESTPHRA